MFGGALIIVPIGLIIILILSLQIYLWKRKSKKEIKNAMQHATEKEGRVQKIKLLLTPLFTENHHSFLVASGEQIMGFVAECRKRNVPVETWEQLVEFYDVTNGIPCLNGFDFHSCDDKALFEWWDNNHALWLATHDDDVLRWVNGKFCLGDASNISFGGKCEFETLLSLLEYILD